MEFDYILWILKKKIISFGVIVMDIRQDFALYLPPQDLKSNFLIYLFMELAFFPIISMAGVFGDLPLWVFRVLAVSRGE